jgi:transposase
MEQNPIKVQRWLEMEYPAIVRRAHIEQAEIYWADETGVRQDAAWARGYAPRGHTPTREHTERRPRYGLTLMSALTNQGLMRFEFFDGGMNADRFIGFMDGLIHDAKLKVFLIVDRLSAHNAHKVEDWLSANNDRIELFFLPPYSPELNPDELVNRDLKTELRTRPATNHTGTLKGIARDFMETLSSLPRRVSRYFLNRHVSYASSEAAMSILLLPA